VPRRLPPLNALRAFEAAARHGGFARAAGELSVTPAAVSHQVKALEAFLGVALFERLPHGLRLTPAGAAYLPELSRGFDQLARAEGRLRGPEVRGPLVVSVLPSLAARWLAPRLSAFHRRHPEVELRVLSAWENADLAAGEADVGLRYGSGDYPGFTVLKVMEERLFPVCAPTLLAAGERPLRDWPDIVLHTLLEDDQVRPDEPWIAFDPWLRRHGLGREAVRRLWFTDANALMAAALAGLGVAMGRSALVAEDLRDGRLVRPFLDSRPADYAYFAVVTEEAAESPRVRAFLGWLREAGAATGDGGG